MAVVVLRVCGAGCAFTTGGAFEVKRDLSYMRELLFEIENNESPAIEVLNFVTQTPEQTKRSQHCELLCDAGLLVVHDERRFYLNEGLPEQDGQNITRARTLRMTSAGHDYLDAIRDEGVWASTKNAVAETGGSAALELVKTIAISFAKKKIEQHTGLEL